jgi:hypothetical protein
MNPHSGENSGVRIFLFWAIVKFFARYESPVFSAKCMLLLFLLISIYSCAQATLAPPFGPARKDAKRRTRLRRPRLKTLEEKGLSVRGVKALSGPIESEPDAKANGKKTFTP